MLNLLDALIVMILFTEPGLFRGSSCEFSVGGESVKSANPCPENVWGPVVGISRYAVLNSFYLVVYAEK